LALLALGTSITGCPESVVDYTPELKFGADGTVCFKTTKAFVIGHLDAKLTIAEDANVFEKAVAIKQPAAETTYKIEATAEAGKELRLYLLDSYEGDYYVITKDHVFDEYPAATYATRFVVIANSSTIEVQTDKALAGTEFEWANEEDDIKIFSVKQNTGGKIVVHIDEKFDDFPEFAGKLGDEPLTSSSEFEQLPNLEYADFAICKNVFKNIDETLTLENNKVCLKTDIGFVFQTQNMNIVQQVSGAASPVKSTKTFAITATKGAYYVLTYVAPAAARKTLADPTEVNLFKLPKNDAFEDIEAKYFLISDNKNFKVTSLINQKDKKFVSGSKLDYITVISDKATVTITKGEKSKVIVLPSLTPAGDVYTIENEGAYTFSIVYDGEEDGTFKPSATIDVAIAADSALASTMPKFVGYLPKENEAPLQADNLDTKKSEGPTDYATAPSVDPPTPEPDEDDDTTVIVIVVVVVVVVLIVAGVLVYFFVFRNKSDSDPEKQNIDNDEENGEQLKKDDVFLGDEKKDVEAAPAAADGNNDEFAL